MATDITFWCMVLCGSGLLYSVQVLRIGSKGKATASRSCVLGDTARYVSTQDVHLTRRHTHDTSRAELLARGI